MATGDSDSDQLPDVQAAVPAVPRFDLSTDAIRKTERFSYFCDVVASHYMGFDAAERGHGDFAGRMTGSAVGETALIYSSIAPAAWDRQRRSLLDADESLMLMRIDHGRALLRQAGEELMVGPGDVALYPSTMPAQVALLEHTAGLSIKVPRSAIETALPPGLTLGPTFFQPGNSVIALLSGYAQSVIATQDSLDARAAETASRHIADLIALAIGANRDAEHELSGRGLKAARTKAILAMIRERATSPFLSPRTVGAAIGISDRHVHRLLEETNRTFYEHLLEARLSIAFRLLRDPANNAMSVGEIAMMSGFANLSYFSREFRIRFGDTPTGVRSSRSGDPSAL